MARPTLLTLILPLVMAGPAVAFEFASIDGGELDLDAWRGRPVLVVNTASGKHTARDSKAIRQAALNYKVPYCTTIAAARATATAIGSRRDEIHVESLQEYYAREARG